MKNVFCYNCGAKSEIDENMEHFFCYNCGVRINNPYYLGNNYSSSLEPEINESDYTSAGSHFTPINDDELSVNKPTLIIQYSSTKKSVTMGTSFVGEMGNYYNPAEYVNNQKHSFILEPGRYKMIFRIGRRSYSRWIVIPENMRTTFIECSWSGMAHITIHEPDNADYNLNSSMILPKSMAIKCPSCSAENTIYGYCTKYQCGYCGRIYDYKYKARPIPNSILNTQVAGTWDCPACRSTMILNNDHQRWLCPSCGFGIAENEVENIVFWFCNDCDSFLNIQPGFNTRMGTWKCSQCGHLNDVSEGNIL